MITYTIEEPQQLIRAQMSGSCSYEDMERHLADVYQDPRYNTSLRTIFQVDQDAGGPILQELPRVKELLEMASQTPRALRKWAVVMPAGFKRTVVEFLMKDVHLQSLEMRFFANETAALAWLDAK